MPRSSPVHVLSHVDIEARTATCAACGPVRIRPSGVQISGLTHYRCAPSEPARPRWNRKRNTAQWNKQDLLKSCPRCGAFIEHPCQLDSDHVVPLSQGGPDHPANLQTMCANCHRLKSLLERRAGQLPADFMTRYPLTD